MKNFFVTIGKILIYIPKIILMYILLSFEMAIEFSSQRNFITAAFLSLFIICITFYGLIWGFTFSKEHDSNIVGIISKDMFEFVSVAYFFTLVVVTILVDKESLFEGEFRRIRMFSYAGLIVTLVSTALVPIYIAGYAMFVIGIFTFSFTASLLGY